MKRRDRAGTVVAWQWSRLGRISQAQDRSADWRARARRSKTFIVRRKAPKGPNRSALWFRYIRWLRGLDLNQRPLGYEYNTAMPGNPLILREKRSTARSSTFPVDA